MDILETVIDMMGVRDTADRDSARDMASVAGTCKKLLMYIEPCLYGNIHTRIGTAHDIGDEGRLLCKRLAISARVYTLVLNDFDRRQTRCLGSFGFPRL